MNAQTKRTIAKLQNARLPELQSKYQELFGEPTRCPNRKFLLRKITEALTADGGQATQDPAKATRRGRFSGMSIAELQAKYLEIVGRPTSSSHSGYLQWKIREAEKGNIRVGPARPRRTGGEPTNMKTLPLRLPSDAVTTMDAAWQAHAIPSRNEFLRRAIHCYLTSLGDADAAASFGGDT